MYSNDTAPRRRLTDILRGNLEALRDQWNSTKTATDFLPLPAGTYECHVRDIRLFNATTGTPGVKIRFDVCEGEYVGRALFHDCWLTPAALPQTKRDLLKLGIDSFDTLESATVPPGRIRCKVRVALRRNDDGVEHNRVVRFDVIGIDEPERDPFAPDDCKVVKDDLGNQGATVAGCRPAGGFVKNEPADPFSRAKSAPVGEVDAGDASFNYGANVNPERGASCN